MYYLTYDPYDEKYDMFLRDIIKREDETFQNNNKNNSEECIICLENSSILNEVHCLQLTNIIHITCQCNVFIHDKCLEKWVNKYNSCPICRTPYNILNISFSGPTENIFRFCNTLLCEYKTIFYVIFTYLIFLQISIFYFLIIYQTKYYEIKDVYYEIKDVYYLNHTLLQLL